ncbi:sulfur transfer complex TusBCD TusB component (DsrH family) [Bradyrhizobium japonicum]
MAEASQAAPVASGHRATSYPHLSTEDRNFIDTVIPHEHDAAQSSAAKRRRTLPDLEEVVIYRQSNANAASGESSGAPQVATTGIIVRGRSDERPLYSKDAAVLKLEHALIERGMKSRGAHEHVSRLITYSRWLFENKLPSIVDRLDSKSLIDDGAIHKYTGGRNADLLKSLNYFRTFWAAEELVVRAKRDNSSQSALLNPESAVQMEPRRIDGTAGSRGPGHPHLSTEDRNLIDSAIAQYAAQKNPKPGTVRAYTKSLYRLGNDLRARGQTTDLANHDALAEHVNTYFSDNENIKAALSVLRPHNTYPHLSTEDRNHIDSAIAQYAAQNNSQPETVKSYTQALYRLGNDFRARGQTTDLANHDALVEHANTHFRTNGKIRTGLSVLRAYHDPAPDYLSTEDRNHIDSAIAQYVAQNNSQPKTVRRYTQALHRLVNDLRARGQTTDLADYKSLLDHATTYFPNNPMIKAGLSVLRAYHDPNHLVSRGRPRALPSGKDASNDVQQTLRQRTDARAGSNLLPSEGVLINHEHDTAQSRAAKRRRTLIDPSPQNVALINPESAAPMGPLRIDAAAAQHSAPHEASTRLGELQEEQDGQHAPSAFTQEQTAFHSEQLPQGELQRLETQLQDEHHGVGDNHPAQSFPVDSEEFTFDLDQFHPGELRRLLDDDPAEELQERRDDHSAPSAFIQAQAAFHSEQLPQGELERLEKQLHDELQGRRDNHPALSFSIDPEDLTLDRELFSPEELLRPLDDEPAEELQERRDDHPAPSAFIQAQAAFPFRATPARGA